MIFRITVVIFFSCFCSLFSQEKSISELQNELNATEDIEQKINLLEKLWQKTTYENENEAINYAAESIKLAKTISNEKLLAKAYEQLGISHSNISNYEASNENYEKAIVLQEKLGNTNRLGNILINKGINFKDVGQLDKALEYLERAKDYLTTVNTRQDSSLLSKYYSIKANFLMSKAFYTSALENATKAIKLNKKLNENLRYADNLQIIADANESLGNKAISIEYFKESLAIYQKENDTYFETDVCIKIGFLYANLKPIEVDSAIHYYERASKLAKKIDVPSLKSRAQIDHAKLLIKINKLTDADILLNESMPLVEKISDTFGLSDIYLNKGLINLRTNNLNKAKENIEEALILKQKIGLLSGMTEAKKHLASIAFNNGDYKEAYQLHEEFKILSDSIYKKEKAIKFNELQVLFDTQKKESKIALQNQEIKTLNIQAKNDRLTKTLYGIGMFSFLSIAALLYFGFKQRIKKNKLAREKQEEIYKQEIAFKKKELASQTLHLVQKSTFIQELKENLEKIKKSPELFKVEFRRLVMLLKKESAEDKDWEVFKSYFSEVHNNFDKKIKSIANDITEKEMRLASFLRMNLSTKEIASMLNVLPDSVLKSKYRLKKKLALSKEEDLTQFLNTL